MIRRNCDLRGVSHLRRWVLTLLIMMVVVGVNAQPPKKRPPFNPAKFEADLEKYIAAHACLLPSESAKFFPVYREMMKKQRMMFDEMRKFREFTPRDNEGCAESIRRLDELDIRMKQLQQEYHSRFMTILPAKKVLSIIKAEEQFHRQIFKKMR